MPVHSLIGRGHQLERLTALIDAAPDHGSAVVIVGDPGIGKTSLLDEARHYAANSGAQVLTTVGVETESPLPYAGLHHLLRPILPGITALPDPQRLALLSAFGAVDQVRPEPFLIALAALNLLVETAQQPLVVLADDLQWLDLPSHDALAFIARRVSLDPIVVIGVTRSETLGPFVAAGLDEIAVHRLSEVESAELLARQPGLDGRLRREILAAADGNPLALVELPRAWRTRSEREAVPTVLPVTTRLERSFTGRMAALPQATRDALLVAAISDSDGIAEIMLAANTFSAGPMTVAELEPALSAGLIVADEATVHFRHPLVRSAVVQAESISRRHLAHAAVAGTLVADPYRRAWHRAQAIVGPDDEVAAELAATAPQSISRGAAGVAIRSLERAAQLTSDPALRGRRLLLAAEYAFDLGRADLVASLVGEADQMPLSDLDRARQQWLTEIFHDGIPGDPVRVLDLAEVAISADATGDPDLADKLLLGAALRCWWADTGPAARARVAEVARKLDGLDLRPRRIAALAVAEPVLAATEVLELLDGFVIEAITDADVLRLLGMAAHAVGHSTLAADFLDRAEWRLRAQGRFGVLPHVLVWTLPVRLALGDWDRAAAAAEEGRQLSEETGQPIWSAGAVVCAARGLALRGERAQALQLAAEAELAANGKGLNDLLACVQLARGAAWTTSGNYDEAYHELCRLFDPADSAYHRRESYPGITMLADAAVHTGRTDHARSVVADLEAVAAVSPSPDLRVYLAYCRAVLAPDDVAEHRYLEALGTNMTRWPWIRARTELAYGSWLRRRRRVIESRIHLRTAMATFDLIVAPHWSQQAAAELRAAGERTTQEVGAAALLSAQELQIARLAAHGMSNREIGQQLYLSPRTVGSHLYRIFPKLGVTSRAQLAAELRTT